MWKLLTLLGLGLFLGMLIGGQDNGQVRQGLMTAPETAPAVSAAAFDPDKIVPEAAPAGKVDLAVFVPVAAPAPAEPAAAPAAEVAAAPAPAEPVQAEPVAAEPVAAVETPPVLPVRWVKAGSINLRDGPSTSNGVIGRLTRNEAVSIVGDAGDGWVLVRLEGDGGEGYVAARLLTDVDPTP